MVLYFQPNQLIDKYWQMAGGSYTIVTNHKKCWLGLKMCLCLNLYVLIWTIAHYQVYEILYVFFLWSFKFMKFYVWYFQFLLVPWVKNVTKWMCRTFEHLDSPMQKNCSGVGGEYEFSRWFNYVQVLFRNSCLQRLF